MSKPAPGDCTDPAFLGLIAAIIQTAGKKQPWRNEAACLDAPSSYFFPVDPKDAAAPGYSFCDVCPVQQECLGYSLTERIVDLDVDETTRGSNRTRRALDGIWGGTSKKGRAVLRG